MLELMFLFIKLDFPSVKLELLTIYIDFYDFTGAVLFGQFKNISFTSMIKKRGVNFDSSDAGGGGGEEGKGRSLPHPREKKFFVVSFSLLATRENALLLLM